MAAFSISEVVFRCLKLSFGRRFLKFVLFFVVDGPGDSLVLAKLGLGMGEKLTFFGVWLGVTGMFILTKSSVVSSRDFGDISKTRSSRIWSWRDGISSVISVWSPPYKMEIVRKNNYQLSDILEILSSFKRWKANKEASVYQILDSIESWVGIRFCKTRRRPDRSVLKVAQVVSYCHKTLKI